MNSAAEEIFSDRHGEFESIAARYSPVLFGVALRRLRNVEDAEDAVQDALLSAYKHFGQFEGRAQLSTWLTRIVINAAGMKLRSRPRQDTVSFDQTPGDGETTLANVLVDARPNPETICAQTEMEETLRAALARVSSKLRVAFQLREMAGYSTREAAQVLGITINTMKARVSRARAAIGLQLRKVEAAKLADELKPPMINRRYLPERVSRLGKRSGSSRNGWGRSGPETAALVKLHRDTVRSPVNTRDHASPRRHAGRPNETSMDRNISSCLRSSN